MLVIVAAAGCKLTSIYGQSERSPIGVGPKVLRFSGNFEMYTKDFDFPFCCSTPSGAEVDDEFPINSLSI